MADLDRDTYGLIEQLATMTESRDSWRTTAIKRFVDIVALDSRVNRLRRGLMLTTDPRAIVLEAVLLPGDLGE